MIAIRCSLALTLFLSSCAAHSYNYAQKRNEPNPFELLFAGTAPSESHHDGCGCCTLSERMDRMHQETMELRRENSRQPQHFPNLFRNIK